MQHSYWKGQRILRPAKRKLLVVLPNIPGPFQGLFFPLCPLGTLPPYFFLSTIRDTDWAVLSSVTIPSTKFFCFVTSHSLESAHLPAHN